MTITRLDLAPILLLSTHDRPAAYGTLAYLPARLVDRDKAFSSLGLEPNRLLITAQLRSHVRVFAQIASTLGSRSILASLHVFLQLTRKEQELKIRRGQV